MHLACRYGSSHNAVKLAKRLNCSRTFSSVSHLQYEGLKTSLGTYEPNANPNPHARSIAVLGGGISGLTTAFNLTRDIPNAKITIYEAKDRLGGWVDSEQVEANDGSVLFEWGPRTLRPDLAGNGLATILLVAQLGDLSKSIRGIPYGAPAAANRFLYYPDHLVRMPAPDPNRGIFSNLFRNFTTLLTEPIFKGVLGALLAEPTVDCRSRDVADDSVGDFMLRRFGPTITDNLLSALYHGIYAGDIYKLSAATLLPKLWYLETRANDNSGVFMESMDLVFKSHSLKSFDSVRLVNRTRLEAAPSLGSSFNSNRVSNVPGPEFDFLRAMMRPTSVYSFVKGIGQLTDKLLDVLRSNSNVTIRSSADLKSLSFDPSNRKFSVKNGHDQGVEKFDYAVSSLSPGKLGDLIRNEHADDNTAQDQNKVAPQLPNLYASPNSLKSVNVMVVNLYYESTKLPIPAGFGYLIPRTAPFDQNPERALGVIFASETAGPRGSGAISTVMELDETKAETLKNALREIRDRHVKEDTPGATRKTEIDNLYPSIVDEKDYKEKQIQIGQDTATGTKLSVMLGGHWWDGWAESDLPSESEGIDMAKSVIARHLKINEQPLIAKARLQRECIPQYPVNYRTDMGKIHRELVQAFEGRLKVLGPWWQGGVGLNDCVKTAKDTSRRIREAWDHETGLEEYTQPQKWVLEDRRTGTQVMDPLQKS